MIVNVPAISVFLKRQFLSDTDKESFEKGFVYGARIERHKAIQFMVLLESGASFWGLPINALTTRINVETLELKEAQFWSNLCESANALELAFIRRMACSVKLKSGKIEKGTYRFTIDYQEMGTLSDTPDQHKCAHIIELDSGHLVAYPNNRIVFHDASLTDGSAPQCNYRVNQIEYLIDEGGIDNSGRWDY